MSDTPLFDSFESAAGSGEPARDKAQNTAQNSSVDANIMPRVRKDAPDTSHAAAQAIARVTGRKRRQVFDFIDAQGEYGATDSEMSAGTGIILQTVNGRRNELQHMGVIVLSGRYRLTPSGCNARVWVTRRVADAANGAIGGGE